MKVSLIIPLRDEAASVVPLLESIAGQSRRPDEVVVVDAGSTDGTGALVTTFGGRPTTGSPSRTEESAWRPAGWRSW